MGNRNTTVCTHEKTIELIVAPYLKEQHVVSRVGNYPMNINKTFVIVC